MFRYKLRTLLIVLALGPPLLAFGGRAAAKTFHDWVRPVRKSVIKSGFAPVESIRAPANHPNDSRP